MKTLYLIVFMLFSAKLMADEVPLSLIMSVDDKGKETILAEISLRKSPTDPALTKSGEAVNTVQTLYRSCFTPDMTDKQLSDLTSAIQATYPDMTLQDIKNRYEKWKKYQSDPGNYVESDSYSNPDLAEFLDGMKKDNATGLLMGDISSAGCGAWPGEKLKDNLNRCLACARRKGETFDQQIKRCEEYVSKNAKEALRRMKNVLSCEINFDCILPNVTVPKKTQTEKLKNVKKECLAEKDIFYSNSPIMSDESSVKKCLDQIPAGAKNIVVNYECCSTTVKRFKKNQDLIKLLEPYGLTDDQTNLTLTTGRQIKLEDLLTNTLRNKGFAETDYQVSAVDMNMNENYYYDPKTDKFYSTGTCGPLTTVKPELRPFYKDGVNLLVEDWVINNESATRNYVTSECIAEDQNFPRKGPHFDWINKKAIEVDPKTADDAMSEWRYNKFYLSWDIKDTELTTEPETNPYSSVMIRNPKVVCLKIFGKAAGKGIRVTGGVKKKWYQGKRKPNTGSVNVRQKGPDVSCPVNFGKGN